MPGSEFEVIKEYFTFKKNRDDVNITVGDDCAMVTVPLGKQLLVTTDTLISGVHFPKSTSAQDIAYKSIMVNLSDLAAMGATPAWVTLAITLPEVDESWLQAFSQQLDSILSEYNICLIGGDTTKGHLSITVQAMGLCDQGKVLCRDKAEVGDKIFVTGDLGDAAIGLNVVQDNIHNEVYTSCIDKLNRPQARVKFGQELVAYSKCAIDISDGLVADLGHILSASGKGAIVELPAIPLSSCARKYFEQYNKGEIDWTLVLAHGDDYELCFTVNSENEAAVRELATKQQLKISCVGEITNTSKLLFFSEENKEMKFSDSGFQHF